MPFGRALRHRNYRLFFVGQGISLIGTWLTRFAMGYATYGLGHSVWQLGVVAFCSQAPTAIIAPFAGVLVDRWSRHRTLVWTQVAAMLQSGALAALALSGSMTVARLALLGALQAVINAFDMPARQSFVRQMVDDPADLPNAIALNSSLVNVARLAGPVAAAALAGLVGLGWCFAIDAASYLAVIASLLAMRVPPQPVRPVGRAVLHQLREGLAYVWGDPLLRSLLVLFAITSTFGGGYASLLPAYASASLGGGAGALGALMAGVGAGALVGALLLAARRGSAGLPRIAAWCGVALGAGLVAFELAPTVAAAVPITLVVGAASIVQWAATNTVIQSSAREDMLGRVISLYAVVFFGGVPIGALIDGAVAERLGAVHTFALAGAGCVACSLYYRRRLTR